MRRQLGGSTSQVGRYPPPPLGEMDTLGREIYTEPAERNNCPSLQGAPVQHWLSSSTWSSCSGTRSSPGCPSGSAWQPAPACPALRDTSASQNSFPVSGAGSL